MFVFSVKTSRRRLLSLFLCVGVLVLILIAAFLWPSEKQSTAATVIAADNTARITYLTSLGYKVDSTYSEVCEVLIPDEFDGVFAQYNAMQQAANMDFTAYRGKRLKCWSYRLLNAPYEGETIAHLYMYADEIVGGDITQAVTDGQMAALVPRERL